MTDDCIKSGSDRLFDTWPEKYGQWFDTPIGRLVKQHEQRLVMELLQPGPGELILDAGCGSGLFTLPLVRAGAVVAGLDVSEPMLRYARRTLRGDRFSPLIGTMLELPFSGDTFDKAVSITALEFIEEGQRAMEELFRVTRPGGRVVVATLNRLSPWAQRRANAARQDERSVFRHAVFRSPGELSALAGRDGVVKTAVHFAKHADPEAARRQERVGEAAGSDRGAFVIGCWRK